MRFKPRLFGLCAILIISLVLIVQECDALKGGSSRKSSSGRGSSGRGSSTSNSGGNSWLSRVTGGGSSSSSASKASSSSATNNKKMPEPSAPRYEEKKPIGWNVPGINNPGAPPAYSNTHTKGLSNPNLQNPPPYSKNSPPGHQTIQSNNNPIQNQGLNYPRNVGQQSAGYPVQSNMQNQYQGLNYPRNTGQQYSGQQYSGYPGSSYPNQGGHYSGVNYAGGGYSGHSGYSGYPSYNAAPSAYFASGYPIGNSNYGRSSSGNTLTNALLAGTVGLGLYNAIRPYPSYSGGSYGGGGSTVHHHYYNNQAAGANPNSVQTPAQAPAPAQAIPSDQNTNAVQTPLAPMPQIPLANNSSSDPTAALVTPPPPTLAPNEKITDLDCVYAMKILNCSEISQCPQEWLHPSCLNRTISKEYFDSITLPPPPPLPLENQQQANLATPEKTGASGDLTNIGQNTNQNPDQNLYSSNQQLPVVSSSNSSSKAAITMDYSLCLTIILGIATLTNKF